MNAVCEFCDDGDGVCIYPYYGIAPHMHTHQGPDSTQLMPEVMWPKNFEPDPEPGGGGVYTHCLNCGAPKKETP